MKKNTKYMLAVFSVLLIMTAAYFTITSVAAQDTEEEREIEIEQGGDYVWISSYSSSETNEAEYENALEIGIDTSGYEGPINIEIEYYAESENGSVSSESELYFSLTFHNLIEFTDDDGNGYFTSAGDTVVQTASLGDLSPVYLAPTVTSITESGVAGYQIDIKGVIPFSGTDFNFTIVGYVFEGSAELDGVSVYPGQFKFDIGIDGFPFVSMDNKLALEMILESELEVEQESGEDEFVIESGGVNGYFGWIDTALVDGVNTPVTDSTNNVGGDDYVYLCYEAGDSILHDPTLGLYYQAKRIPGFSLVAIAGFITLGIFVVIIRKFRKK